MNREEKLLFRLFSANIKAKKSYIHTLTELKEFVNKDLLDITTKDVELYLENLRKSEQARTTVRRKYYQLFSFYNFLEEDQLLIEPNPLKKIPVPKASNQVKMERTLSFEDLEVLLKTLEDHFPYRDYVLTLLIATTGLRLGEALNLKWSSFFIDDNGLIGAEINKRYVRIFDFVWTKLDTYRKEFLGVDESYLGENYYVFIGEKQLNNYKTYPALVKPITGDWVRKTYVKACEMADINLVTAKDIRHTYTMLTMKMGMPAEDIKNQVGWSSTQFLNRYHGVVEMLDTPINKHVEEYFKLIFRH